MSALSTLTITETKLLLRDKAVSFFSLAFPILLLIILGSIPSFRQPDPKNGALTVIWLYVPILIAMALAMLALNGMPAALGTYREKGVLRRNDYGRVMNKTCPISNFTSEESII